MNTGLAGGLYVVATPIGNLGDITARALEVLRGVELIAAEDTRHSAVLLRHFGIETPLAAYHDHSAQRDLQRVERVLAGGAAVALISDAGTPMISDPGYRLTRFAHEAGYPVIPVPGASAVVAALSVSGLPTDRFSFEGFLPAKAAGRRSRLEALAERVETTVFYEAPHRLQEALSDMVDLLGADRPALLARELTKSFETVRKATLGDLLDLVMADANQSRGEIVLVVAGAEPRDRSLDTDTQRLLDLLAEEMPPRKAAALAAQYTGLKKNALYQYLLERRGE